MITKDLALNLSIGRVLYHKTLTNADGTPLRARINGKCKAWVSRPEEFRLPMKYGLRSSFYIEPGVNADQWTHIEPVKGRQ